MQSLPTPADLARKLRRFVPYRALELPIVYNLAQFVLAPGSKRPVLGKMRAIAATLPRGDRVLDVGCGPISWLPEIGVRPIALDSLGSYTSQLHRAGIPAVTASATALPFADGAIDGAWCMAVLHHLDDDCARAAIREMQRVVRPGGYVVIWDPVLPARPLRKPIAWTIFKLDRGGWVRTAAGFRALFDDEREWQFDYLSYTLYGFESYFCVFRRPSDS